MPSLVNLKSNVEDRVLNIIEEWAFEWGFREYAILKGLESCEDILKLAKINATNREFCNDMDEDIRMLCRRHFLLDVFSGGKLRNNLCELAECIATKLEQAVDKTRDRIYETKMKARAEKYDNMKSEDAC